MRGDTIAGIEALLPDVMTIIRRGIPNSRNVILLDGKEPKGWQLARGNTSLDEKIFLLLDGTFAAVGQRTARQVELEWLQDRQLEVILVQLQRLVENS